MVSTESGPWLRALSELYPVPEEYRIGFFDRAGAIELLRCGSETFDELVRAGLPYAGELGAERYDRFDLFNLALASGTMTSVPEKAIHYALRWMNYGPQTWTARLDWSFHVTLECAQQECGADPYFTHARLLPEAVGGRIHEWQVDPGGAVIDDQLCYAGPGPLVFSGHVSTSGKLMGLRSPQLRKIVDDFFAEGYRWVRLPEPLQWEYQRLLSAGVSPCISASLFLEREFQRAGYRTFTRRGWLLGMLDLAHSWVEVLDDDGVIKPVDPIFRFLTAHADRPHPELARASIGSRMNRLLPAAMAANELMATHRCGGRESEPRRKAVIRRKILTTVPEGTGS